MKISLKNIYEIIDDPINPDTVYWHINSLIISEPDVKHYLNLISHFKIFRT